LPDPRLGSVIELDRRNMDGLFNLDVVGKGLTEFSSDPDTATITMLIPSENPLRAQVLGS